MGREEWGFSLGREAGARGEEQGGEVVNMRWKKGKPGGGEKRKKGRWGDVKLMEKGRKGK